MMRGLIPWLVLLTVWLLPEVAHACPVCGQALEESRVAFIITTAFMTLLPLVVLGSTGYWVVRRIKRMEAEDAAAEAAALQSDQAQPDQAQPDPAE